MIREKIAQWLLSPAIISKVRMEQTLEDDTGWRRASIKSGLGGNDIGGTPDLQSRPQIIRLGRQILRKNPFLRKSYMEPMIACVIGSGFKFKAKKENKALQDVLDTFIKRNDISTKFQMFLYALYLTEGELILPFKVNPTTGSLKVTYVYSDDYTVDFSPDDNRVVAAIYKSATKDISFTPVTGTTDKPGLFSGLKPVDKTAGVDVTPPNGTPTYAAYIKGIDSTSKRGLPPIFSIVDYADALDNFFFTRLDMLKTLMRVWVDVSVDGTKDDVKDIADKYKTIPDAGSADVHNAKVEIKPQKFDFDGGEVRADVETFLKSFTMATGVPHPWILGEQPIDAGALFAKMAIVEQEIMKEVYTLLIDCEIEAKKATGVLSADVDTSYTVIVPEISIKDIGKMATAMNQIMLALMTMTQESWVESKDAAEAAVEAVNMTLDTELAPVADPDALAKEKAPPMAPIVPGGGGTQGGQADAFNKFTRKGQLINQNTKTTVTRA